MAKIKTYCATEQVPTMKMKSLRRLLLCSASFTAVLLKVDTTHSQTIIDGTWHSSFQVMGQSMLIDLNISPSAENGNYLSDPAHSEQHMDLSSFSFEGDSLLFRWAKGNLDYAGRYSVAGDSISGTMKQSGLSWPVTFKREMQQLIVAVRPQKPVAPFPYSSQEVSYFNTEDSTQVFATLTYPAEPTGDYPVVIFASGSGPQDRNCTLLGHEPFLLLADQFARNGIATLRFDDRGTGQSKANYFKASLTDFGNDVASGIAFLQTRPELADHPLGLLGHSEGGMHILLAQQQFPKQVDFMIFLSCIGITGKEVLIQQQYDIPLRSGGGEQVAAWNRSVYEGLTAIVLKQKDPVKAGEKIGVFLRSQYKKAPEGALEGMNETQYVMANSYMLNNDWGRQFLVFDAGAYLKKYKGPGLALFGEKDLQVDAATNLAGFKKALAMNPAFQYIIYPGINHLMQTCASCTISEYGDLTETIAPGVIDTVITYIKDCKR